MNAAVDEVGTIAGVQCWLSHLLRTGGGTEFRNPRRGAIARAMREAEEQALAFVNISHARSGLSERIRARFGNRV